MVGPTFPPRLPAQPIIAQSVLFITHQDTPAAPHPRREKHALRQCRTSVTQSIHKLLVIHVSREDQRGHYCHDRPGQAKFSPRLSDNKVANGSLSCMRILYHRHIRLDLTDTVIIRTSHEEACICKRLVFIFVMLHNIGASWSSWYDLSGCTAFPCRCVPHVSYPVNRK